MYSLVLTMVLSGGATAPAGSPEVIYLEGSGCQGDCTGKHGWFSHKSSDCYGCCGGSHGGFFGNLFHKHQSCYGCCGGTIVTTEHAAPPPPPPPAKPEPIAPPKDDKKGAAAAAPAQIVVELPADARLLIDDRATKSSTGQRTFVTPALEPGFSYSYTLTAEVVRDGNTRRDTKLVTVAPGETARISFPTGPGSEPVANTQAVSAR